LSEAKRQQVKVAICNPCFELWLLLHHRDEEACRGLGRCADVEEELRGVLGTYNKRRLEPNHFSRRSVVEACARARGLDQSPAGAIPDGMAAQVYRILGSIAEGAAEHQLPPEFRVLRA
jgi:hypothetical protein